MGEPWFYGLQPRWFSWDRLYKIHILADGIAGAYLAGQVYDELSGILQMEDPAGIFSPLMRLWVRRLVRRRAEREDMYRSLTPGSQEFLSADGRNFRLNYDDIDSVAVSPKRALWTAWGANSGSIQVVTRVGRQQRFILVNDQDVSVIEQALVNAIGASRVNVV